MAAATLPIRGSRFAGPSAEDRIFEARDHARGSVTLKPDDKNRHDVHAVSIRIDGQHVGFVPRANAPGVPRWLASGAIRRPIAVVDPWDIKLEVEGI